MLDRAPWHRYHKRHGQRIPERHTLSHWRQLAHKRAKEVGALCACELCKRPIMRYGYIWLRTPNAWRQPAKKRRICHTCYILLDTHIAEMETAGALDHLPPEDLALEPDDGRDLSKNGKRSE